MEGLGVTAPMRAYRLTLKLDADSLHELADALCGIADRAERGELTVGVSGAPSSGYLYELLHDPAQTHDNYHAQIRAYLRATQPADTSECIGLVL